MKKSLICTLTTALGALSLAGSANAQIVTAPATDALLGLTNGELTALNTAVGAANASLRIIATDTTGMITMFRAPTPVVPAFAAIEAGGALEAGSDELEYNPDLAGYLTTKPTAIAINRAVSLGVDADELAGIATGDPAGKLRDRQQKIGANIQGEVYNDLLLHAKRYVAAQALMVPLQGLDIKATLAYGVAAQLETIKSLSLLAQTMSYNTAAVVETFMSNVRSAARMASDHAKTALLF